MAPSSSYSYCFDRAILTKSERDREFLPVLNMNERDMGHREEITQVARTANKCGGSIWQVRASSIGTGEVLHRLGVPGRSLSACCTARVPETRAAALPLPGLLLGPSGGPSLLGLRRTRAMPGSQSLSFGLRPWRVLHCLEVPASAEGQHWERGVFQDAPVAKNMLLPACQLLHRTRQSTTPSFACA